LKLRVERVHGFSSLQRRSCSIFQNVEQLGTDCQEFLALMRAGCFNPRLELRMHGRDVPEGLVVSVPGCLDPFKVTESLERST
jgi:hypothetical protein